MLIKILIFLFQLSPEILDSVEPEQLDPVEPEQLDPVEPKQIDPVEPEQLDPIEPEQIDLVEPEQLDPVDLVETPDRSLDSLMKKLTAAENRNAELNDRISKFVLYCR